MRKGELVAAMAAEAGISQKEAKAALEGMMKAVMRALERGDRVTLIGFGSWKVARRKERMGRHPRTGEPLLIPARKVPHFKAGKHLKDAVWTRKEPSLL